MHKYYHAIVLLHSLHLHDHTLRFHLRNTLINLRTLRVGFCQILGQTFLIRDMTKGIGFLSTFDDLPFSTLRRKCLNYIIISHHSNSSNIF